MMEDILEFSPGLQCCIRCGRVLTDRRLHDRLEDPILLAIQNEHPDWVTPDGECMPCLTRYREILNDRLRRDEELATRNKQAWGSRLKEFFGKSAGVSGELNASQY